MLGQLLDPIADKLLTTAAFVSLVQLDLAPAWMVAIVIGRELAVTGLRGVAHTRGLVMPASGLGKLKMVAQVVAILALMLASDLAGEPGRWLHLLGLGACGWCSRLALWSAVEYYQTFTAVVSGRTSPPGEAPIEPEPAGGPVLEPAGTATTSAASASAPSPSARAFGADCFGAVSFGDSLRRRLLRRRLFRRYRERWCRGGVLELGEPLLRLLDVVALLEFLRRSSRAAAGFGRAVQLASESAR